MSTLESSTALTPDVALAQYDDAVGAARDLFRLNTGVVGITSHDTTERAMAAFLVHYSALSVPITEPVEGWLRRAGERCIALGWPALGRALTAHAVAEAGHHLYHVADCRSLIALWNRRWRPALHVDDIARLTMTPGGARYCALHEANIASDRPFCQLAIEYEIERLPVELGPRFIENCVRLFGDEILQSLTFVTSHVEFDVGHTKFNAHFLGNLIAENPARLESLVTAGAGALDAFGQHLDDCWQLGLELAGRA
jgi:hypothetical protein